MQRKINSIEAFRFFFMMMICVWHYRSTDIMANGYIAVEFFFILSGVLLFFSVNKKNAIGTFDYTLKKIMRFAPDCLIVIIYAYLRHMILPVLFCKKDLDLTWLLQILPECLFLQNIGIYTGGVNYPMWYVSVLLCGGALIYAIIRFNKKSAISIILPLTVLLGYTYIFNMDRRGRIDSFETYDGIYMPMLRGVCGMSLGVLLGYLLKTYKYKLDHIRIWIIDFLGLISLSLFLLFAFMPFKENFDRYLLIIIPFLLFVCFTEKSVFNKIFKGSIWSYLGGYSWQMLVYHGRIIIPFYIEIKSGLHIQLSETVDLLFFCIITLMLSIIFKVLVSKISSLFKLLILKT